jgi:hypothetical protein
MDTVVNDLVLGGRREEDIIEKLTYKKIEN